MKLRLIYILCLLLLLAAPAMAADTYLGFVTHQGANTVSVFDPNSNSVITTFSTDTSPRSVYVNPSGTLVYVASVSSFTVNVYRTSDYTKMATITTPTAPYSICGNAAGDKIYVGDTGTKIYVINAATNTISKTITSTASGYGEMYRYNDKIYAVKKAASGKVAVIDTTTDAITTYITVGSQPIYVTGNTVLGKVYVANSGTTTVSVIDPVADTVTSTIALGFNNPGQMSIKSDGSKLYVTCTYSNKLVIIDTSTDTVTANVDVGDLPKGCAIEENNGYVYVANYNYSNISVVSTATNTVTAVINLSYGTPDYMGIWKIAPGQNPTEMEVTFTIISTGLLVTDANVSVYDATTGGFISSDNTDDAGNVIFTLITGKRYTVTVTGNDIITSSQSVQVQPNKEQYTINVQTNSQWWNPFKWFNTNGTGNAGNADQTKSITSGYTTAKIGATGYIDVLYNDTTGGTTSVAFSLYYRNNTSGAYELQDTAVVAANNASHNFTILKANGTYRFYANGTNLLFSNNPIPRVGEYTFPVAPFNLGWPESWYMYFEIMVFLIIGYMSTRRKAVMLAGSAFMLFTSWVFLLVGWLNSFSLMVPIGICVFAILVFAYAIAKWRMESGI